MGAKLQELIIELLSDIVGVLKGILGGIFTRPTVWSTPDSYWGKTRFNYCSRRPVEAARTMNATAAAAAAAATAAAAAAATAATAARTRG
ncbi:hypothetical protein Pmar_PMAR008206 [Perkinsus marinus ATCC 50983]|uniref:Uncharacterized protein n=1 Tax=Perkinsus marinus (strain ATCC 50983 / TXsc) TaxID=423536 RepID=C5LNI9_PERM5|nr:hypothetical protein Pmar_PMAR008206 [Perkinsus marinus ATCC 50983]EER01740.1 hypothetical protein Pmar_PMAR008206 [Perkinsus marinus ATCC 50983]|eukprot:XP_002769022.1 hypothetical protein Pmar_PMAR008206 [Perkinsus marinus ATCC 50983]